MKVSLSPDIMLFGRLGLKHQLINYLPNISQVATSLQLSVCVDIVPPGKGEMCRNESLLLETYARPVRQYIIILLLDT